jgi:hypothetical protein
MGVNAHGSSASVIDVLGQLPEQDQRIEALEKIGDQLGAYHPPAGYMIRLRDRLREFILSMRSIRPALREMHTSGPSTRRSSSTSGNKRSRYKQIGTKRVK